jgi:hypothetical protein
MILFIAKDFDSLSSVIIRRALGSTAQTPFRGAVSPFEVINVVFTEVRKPRKTTRVGRGNLRDENTCFATWGINAGKLKGKEG